MKKYLDKLGNNLEKFGDMIKKYVPTGEKRNAEHEKPRSYTIANRKIKQQKLLSQGAFGYIWRAVDTSTGDVFALKRVICSSSEMIEAAKKQIQVMKKLKPCPNLVTYYGGQLIKQSANKATVVILMEFCPGGTLFDQLEKKQHEGFKEAELLRIVESIANGISAIHASGYIHRDIKIQNVLVGKDGNYKICDFGSCTNQTVDFKQVQSKDYADYTDEMEKNTTPMYRPPEIVDPFLQFKVCNKVDVWMLGCILFTLCYMIHPFLEATKIGISRAVFRIPQDTKYSDKINDLIRHMLTPDPEFRPSADSIVDIIQEWKSLKNIPLNKQAEQIKKEQKDNLAKINQYMKKTVEHEGDIPMEELMKLHQKLSKKAEQETVVTSFVTKKLPSNEVKTKVSKNNQNDNVWNFEQQPKKQPSNDFDFFSSAPVEQLKQAAPATQPVFPPSSSPLSSFTTTPTQPMKQQDMMDFFSDDSAPVVSAPPPSQQPSSNNIFDFL